MTDTIKYTLLSPIRFDDGSEQKEVIVREPTIEDLIHVEEQNPRGDSAQLAMLLARMCGMDYERFIKISSRDALRIKRLADQQWGNAEGEDGGPSGDGDA